MTDTIPITQINTTGRVGQIDPKIGKTFYTYNADMSGAFDKSFDFRAYDQAGIFGIPQSIFFDNGSNPSSIEVYVTGTDQYFTCPAFAQGVFTVSANQASTIRLVSVGGATDVVTVAIYNYLLPPSVWYSYGPTNLSAPVKVYGPMAPGVNVAAQPANTPVYIGAIDGGGIFRAVSCDNTGKLQMAGTISISSITIADGNDVAEGATTDVAVTNPASNGSLVALQKGLMTNIGQQTDAQVNAGANGSVIAQLKGISNATGSQGSAAVTNPASSASLIQALKGILTDLGQNADAAVTNPASSASITAINKGQLTGIGQVADAAVTNPASSASIIAALKGILTGINSLFSYRTPATGAQTIVAGAAVDTVILASNANRKGASVTNDSTAVLNLLLANAVSSATVWTVQLQAGNYYEVPFGYTGVIKGIWASATGNARVTELT